MNGTKPTDVFTSLMPIALIFVVFYFFIIRPQQKKAKTHQSMISSVAVGDAIVTSSGIMGTVKKISDEKIMEVEIFSGVICKMLRSSVIEVLSKSNTKKISDTLGRRGGPSRRSRQQRRHQSLGCTPGALQRRAHGWRR